MDIETIKRRMLVKYPTFGSVVAKLKYVENKQIPTAATDGETLYYNQDFLNTLSEDEQIFLFAHEVCHVAFNHIFRSEGKDKELWNIATDAVINALLKDDGLQIVEGGVDIPEAIQYDAEQMYEKLLAEKQQSGNKGNGSDSSQNGKGDNSGNQDGNGNDDNSENQSQSQNGNGSENKDENQSGNGAKEQQEKEKESNSGNQSESSKGENSESKEEGTNGNGSGSQQENGNQNGEESSSNGNMGQSNGDNSQENSEDTNHDVGHDTHSLWDEAIKRAKANKSKSNSNPDTKEQSNENKDKEQEDKKEPSSENKDKEQKDKKEPSSENKDKEQKDNEDKSHDNADKEQEDEKEDSQDSQVKKSEQTKKQEDKKKKDKENERLDEQGEKKTFEQNKIERKKQLDELREILAKQSVGYGSQTNSSRRTVNDIGYAKPLIDWRKLLRDEIDAELDWSYKNADIEDGVVTPHIEELPKAQTEIVLDTSGSIDEILLRNFLRECKNILATSKIKVGCFDTEFYGFNEIRTENDIENMKFEGGGGTNFDVAVNAFSRRVENKIVFTDGRAPMPQKSIDAIWIVFGQEKIKPVGGRVIYVSQEQLRRLKFDRQNRNAGMDR